MLRKSKMIKADDLVPLASNETIKTKSKVRSENGQIIETVIKT